MSSLTCLCATALANVVNDSCSKVEYGNQIVKIFAQKMTGVTFDGTASNTVTVEADWDTKIAAANDDKIVTIANLTGALRPSSAPNTESGNDVPYGGEEVIDKPQEITFNLKYFSATTFADLDQTACWGRIRFWFLDNNNWLWGSESTNGDGVLDASILTTTMSQAGIGVSNKAEANKIAWNDLCQPVPVAQLAFLKDK